MRAVHWCWECCDICCRIMGVWVYMRWHEVAQRARDVGHMWASKDSPAAGATRYGHGLTRRRTREKTGRRTRPWRNISCKIVELMSEKFQESSSSRDDDITTSRLSPKVRLGWLAPPAPRLALRYICMKIHSLSSTRCPRDGTPVFGSSCAVPPQKSVGLFYVRVGCSVAWKFRMDTNSLEWNERP